MGVISEPILAFAILLEFRIGFEGLLVKIIFNIDIIVKFVYLIPANFVYLFPLFLFVAITIQRYPGAKEFHCH
jgi:hypothetical protein